MAAWAAEGTQAASEHDALLALLEEQTDIATKTKLNADYVPGIVTVLHGNELEARGARTVWEALALVPGINPTIDPSGRKQLIIRGIGDNYNSGNVKILLNDVSVNNAKDGFANPALNLPVEQIERLEIIRGPGSAVHGEYAYAGVVNIITRQEGNRIYALTGSNNSTGAGALFSLNRPAQALQMSFNLAAWKSDSAISDSGRDALYNTTTNDAAYSYAPGPSNERSEFGSAVFNLDYDDFSLIAQWNVDGSGDHFGINEVLPPPDERIVSRNKNFTLDISQQIELSPAWEMKLALGTRKYESTRDQQFMLPQGATFFSNPPVVVTAPYDMTIDSSYQEDEIHAGADLHWSGERHRVLASASVSEISVRKSLIEYNAFLPDASPAADMQRNVTAFGLQDEYRHSERFTLTTGLRYDNYSDAGDSLSPRISGVWRLSEQNIVKAQYAHAFRPPNFTEVYYTNDEILPASIDTYELGLIHKHNGTQARATLFHSVLSDLIVYDGAANKYDNTDRARAQGIELEASTAVTATLSLDGNVSYVDSKDEETDESIFGAANWLANVGAALALSADSTLKLQYRYVGDRAREAADTRPDLSAYQSVDLTLNVNNLGHAGLTVRAGIKNLLDEDVRYPAALTTDGSGTPIIGYANDYPRPGRTWWLQASYRY